MNNLLIVLAHRLTTIAKLREPERAKAIVADSLLMKRQILIVSRSRRRAPTLSVLDRLLPGFWSLFLGPRQHRHAAMRIKPSTPLRLRYILRKRKYRLTNCKLVGHPK